MIPQTYCTRDDLEAIWSAAAVMRATDDDEDGSLSSLEESHIARAIERGANVMNASLETRYRLEQLAGNAWCRDCNASLAAYFVATRRGNSAPDQIAADYTQFLDDLLAIRQGQLKVPQAAECFDGVPTVTNFATNLAERRGKVRRVSETSTGEPPPSNRKSFPAES